MVPGILITASTKYDIFTCMINIMMLENDILSASGPGNGTSQDIVL